jgi:hypothetical protein
LPVIFVAIGSLLSGRRMVVQEEETTIKNRHSQEKSQRSKRQGASQ